jgi:hypothetical protein
VNGVQALIDGLAQQVGQPVGVDDRRFRAVAYSSHADEIDPVRRMSILGRQAPGQVTDWLEKMGVARATGHIRVPANPELGMMPRVCFPVRFHDRLLGYLWLVEDHGPLDDDLLERIEHYTSEIAQELFRLEQEELEDHRREADEVRWLTEPIQDAARPHPPLLAPAVRYTVAVVDPGASVPGREADMRLANATARARRNLPPYHLLALVNDGRATIVLAGASDADLERTAQMLLSCATDELADLELSAPTVGVGGVRAATRELPAARHEAEMAARVARSAAPHGPVAMWDALEAYRLVAELSDCRDPEELVPTVLRMLIADPDGDVLVRTVEAYLENGGDASAAATELFIHRSSLYNRLRRVEELSGVSLRSGGARLELHLGLRLLRLAQPSGESTGVEARATKVRRRASPDS